MVPPNWFCLKSGLARPARLLKKLLASNASLRMELEPAAVQTVGARLDLQVDDAAERPAELGRVGGGLHLELVERVDAREDDDRLQPGLVVVDAVEHVVVVARPLAVGRERRRRAPGEAARAVDVRAGDAAQDARDRCASGCTKLRPLSGSASICSVADRRAELGATRSG